jgi:hypothetical protein
VEPMATTRRVFAEGMPRPTCRVANGRVPEDALEEMRSRRHVIRIRMNTNGLSAKGDTSREAIGISSLNEIFINRKQFDSFNTGYDTIGLDDSFHNLRRIRD